MSATIFCNKMSEFRTVRPATGRRLNVLFAALAMLLFAIVWPLSSANAETRTLRMYYTHTKESITVTFKKDGRYVKSGLRKLNRFLRDFRRNEPTRMDPKLFDLVWEVYQKSGCRKPIQVISGYRSPRTNAMLRRRGRKVAKSSQHTRGKALDFRLPGVSVNKLRALGLKAHVGGVGFYRGSFVHLDTGRVRHWPRMSRRQLSRVFPRGRTIHVPSDGRPLKGYKVAAANLKRGLNYDGSKRKTKASKSLLAGLFRKSGNGGDENEGAAVAKKKPAPKPVKKTPAPVAVAKARKQKGADPFATERVVAAKPKAGTEQIAALEQKVEDALTLPKTVAVPRGRPVPKVSIPTTQLALADPLETTSQTELALATPSVPAASAFRPSVDVPTGNSAASTAALQTAQATEDLKSRIRTALSRQRQLSNVETATKQVTTPKLQAPVPSATPKRVERPVLQAALVPPKSADVTTPEWRSNPVAPQAKMAVPIPKTAVKKRVTKRPAEAVARLAPNSNMIGELQLGDLDGSDVKKWAVANSTRIGPIAALMAPIYDQGTRRAAPTLVYSAGFANNRPPLRADRFTGRAMTRVAFADFNANN